MLNGALHRWEMPKIVGASTFISFTEMKRTLILALFAAFFVASPTMAQTLYLHGGAGVPSSTAFNDAYKAGYNASAAVGVPFTSTLEGVLMGRFDRFQQESGFSGGAFSVYSATGNLKLNGPMMNNRFMPYALGGAGLFRLGIENAYESEFGLQFGAGMSVRTSSRMNLMIEPNYVLVLNEGENTQYFPLRVGTSLRL